MLQALIFDLDGTLTHTDSLHFSIWQSYLKEYGLDIDLRFYQEHISGRHNPDFLKQLFQELTLEEIQQISDNKEARFRQLAQDQLKPLSGLEKLLEWLISKELLSAIVTNAPRQNAEFMLNALKLNQFWNTVVISEELPMAKPHPFPYQEALRRLNIAPNSAIVFEDSPSGIRSAVAADIFTVGITTTHNEDVLLSNGASLVISNFNDPQLKTIGVLT
ncbi:putative HAD-superfamily hydrolase, subfamily IA, variant 3 [Crocosphaera subtropica ATCC 51142]|uniref:HAD-superfamily hydrolase, subfamily IA, variant 3 n=1 Tax=Crocosphaera subtropica (strain ATCC 51142 / BH68) TaxID=43989 RepID=B1X2L6_CROS5|nr:HAD-IA family hydrolase [Crocosphaera subtropica]ACB54377.1 putative HAD-superfamily hydrolase, subfamily IA, variant 3 [Crocosphaera subtropica ATCC 51142]